MFTKSFVTACYVKAACNLNTLGLLMVMQFKCCFYNVYCLVSTLQTVVFVVPTCSQQE